MSPLKGHRRSASCLLCCAPALEPVIALKPSALADEYVPPEKASEPQPAYPLEAALCLACGLLQLVDIVDPELLFSEYHYVSAGSPGLVEHFRQAAERIVDLARPPAGALALDIGSNDGTLLRFMKEKRLTVLGVDPARELARRATESGVETLPEFFGAALARRLLIERGPASIITANNVFAHSAALPDMADGVASLLHPAGVFVFEVSYLVDMMANMVFDWIYHEHLCYYSLRPLQGFLARHGLELIDAERIGTKGGSLRCVAQRRGGVRARSPELEALMAAERKLGLERPEPYRAFAAEIEAAKKATLAEVDAARKGGRRLAGFGASPTVTTLLHHFELGERLEFLVDDNPAKHGRLSPGHHLPVLPPAALYERKADDAVVLAWRFAPAIMKRHESFRREGRRFIVPLPRLELFA